MSHPFPYSTIPYAVASKAPKGEWQPTPPEFAEIEWRENGPHSLRFGDCYYSPSGGLAETRYVFHEGAKIAELFSRQSVCTIAELGFGTGLNFLATVALFAAEARDQDQSHKDQGREDQNHVEQTLHYYSFERYPLARPDLERALAAFPELAAFVPRLVKQYPPCVAGMHTLYFAGAAAGLLSGQRAYLHLVFGDVAEFLPRLAAVVDAWFLDGFAPRCNEAMWDAVLFAEIARCSSPVATLATYSAARLVRDSLTAAGFSVEKRPGFAAKREMLTAVRSVSDTDSSADSIADASEYLPKTKSWSRASSSAESSPDVIVVGGGFAGVSSAYVFAERGAKVLLLEEHPRLAQEASGNPAGVIMPYLSVKPDFQSRFYMQGFLQLRRVLELLEVENDVFCPCGVMRLATAARLQTLLETLGEQQLPEEIAQVVDAERASALIGLDVTMPGIWHQYGGMLNPTAMIARLLETAAIATKCAARVTSFTSIDGATRLRTEAGDFSASVVVFANGYRVGELAQTQWLPLEPVKGQLRYLKPNMVLDGLSSVLCFDGYVLPLSEGYLLGATYEHDAPNLDLDEAGENDMLARLEEVISDGLVTSAAVGGGRAAYRTMSPDRMPMIGALPASEHFEQKYLEANDGKFGPVYPHEGRFEGVFCSLGHGSRGLVSSLLAAEVIASMAMGHPLEIEADLLRAVDPARFLVRAIKRGVGV